MGSEAYLFICFFPRTGLHPLLTGSPKLWSSQSVATSSRAPSVSVCSPVGWPEYFGEKHCNEAVNVTAGLDTGTRQVTKMC